MTCRTSESLKNVNNGRKYFLLASKRVVNDKSHRRDFSTLMWRMFRMTSRQTSGMFGAELSAEPELMSFDRRGYVGRAIYELQRDILQIRALSARTMSHGRFIFDLGLRFYPDLLPGVVIDTGVVSRRPAGVLVCL